MAKHWVKITFSENPHPVEPCDAYRAVFQAVSQAGAYLDEMLFDVARGEQFLLITTLTESFAGVAQSLEAHNPEIMQGSLSAFGELPANGVPAA